jgi:SLA1 homology domain 1, SHD1
MTLLKPTIIFCLFLVNHVFADQTFCEAFWNQGQFKQRGETKWQIPTINVVRPQRGQVGILAPRAELGDVKYEVTRIDDDWSLRIGYAIPKLAGSSGGSFQSTRGNKFGVEPAPQFKEFDGELVCRAPTKDFKVGSPVSPFQVFRVNGSVQIQGRELIEVQLATGPEIRSGYEYVGMMLRKSRTWRDSSGTFSVAAKLKSWNASSVMLEKRDGTSLVVSSDKLAAADVRYVEDEKKRIDDACTNMPKPLIGTLNDSLHPSVYAHDSLENLQKYWKSKPRSGSLSEMERKSFGISLVNVGTQVEVIGIRSFTDDANDVGISLEIEVANKDEPPKKYFVASADFMLTP